MAIDTEAKLRAAQVLPFLLPTYPRAGSAVGVDDLQHVAGVYPMIEAAEPQLRSAMALPFLLPAYPVPDGTRVSPDDRRHVAGVYIGPLHVAGVRAAALIFEVDGVEVDHLRASGTIPGVAVVVLAAANGPGTGQLRSTAAGTTLGWKPPGSASFGPGVDCSAGGFFLLEGPDQAQWVRVRVYPQYLTAGPAEGPVTLHEIYNNAVAQDDVTAAESSAGGNVTYPVSTHNVSDQILRQVRVWIDAAVSGLEVSADAASWVSPKVESDALALADIPAGEKRTFYLRRTVSAAATANAKLLNHLHASFEAHF